MSKYELPKYEITGKQRLEIESICKDLDPLNDRVESLVTEMLETYQRNRTRALLNIMRNITALKVALREVLTTRESWESSPFDEFIGRIVTPKPTWPKDEKDK